MPMSKKPLVRGVGDYPPYRATPYRLSDRVAMSAYGAKRPPYGDHVSAPALMVG